MIIEPQIEGVVVDLMILFKKIEFAQFNVSISIFVVISKII